MPFIFRDNQIFLNIRLCPNSSANKLGDIIQNAQGEKQLKVYITAIPEKGKANKALINLLSKTLKISKQNISIVAGEKSRNKICVFNEVSEVFTSYIKENSH